MDRHVQRVVNPFLDAWTRFKADDASVSLLDLSRLCEQAAGALDNTVHNIPIVLGRAAADLEFAYHATDRAQHLSEALRILDPVVVSFESDLQGQTFCDWCYGPLSSRSVAASRAVGLSSEFEFACDRCIDSEAYRTAPDDWDGDEWPFGT